MIARDVPVAMNALVVLLTAMAISMVVIPAVWRLAPRLGLIDKPKPRKIHAVPVARIGGWGLVAGSLLPILFWLPMDRLMASYFLGSLVLFAFGVWDDRVELEPYIKFVGQLMAVLPVVLYGELYIERFPFMGLNTLPEAVGIPFTVFALVGVINAINHSDGLDGLAGGEAMLSLVGIALLAYIAGGDSVVIMTAAVAGGILGFLRYNTYPARVFMGDSGSQFLGFTLGFLAIILTHRVHPSLSAALPLLFLGLPIIDILAVLVQRIYAGMNWFRATRNHIHHRLLALDFDHHQTVVIIYFIQAMFVISAIFLRYESDPLISGLYLGVCTLVFATLMSAERKGWRANDPEDHSRVGSVLAAARSHALYTVGPPVLVGVIVPAYMISGSLLAEAVPRDFGFIASILFVATLVQFTLGRPIRSMVLRSTVYATALFIVYLTMRYPPETQEPLRWIEPIAFVLLAGATGMAIRSSVRAQFRTTPMDYLMLFVVLSLSLFFQQFLERQELVLAGIKAMVILYGCEFLLNRLHGRLNSLSLTALAALGVLGLRGLL